MRIGIIGLGRMGRCMVRGWLDQGTVKAKDLSFTTRQKASATTASAELGIQGAGSNLELVQNADCILLAVKPQNVPQVLQEIAPAMTGDKTLISIVASVCTQEIEEALGSKANVIRAMPNTPAFVGAGITALCRGAHAKDTHLNQAKKLFEAVGQAVVVEEKHMDAVTGLSGCGPAYIYVLLESLTEAGIKVGLNREIARQLAGQTVLGAAKMFIDTGRHPADLKDEVTTPAGCTIDGLMALEEGKFRVTLIKAVVQATKRAKTLAKRAKI